MVDIISIINFHGFSLRAEKASEVVPPNIREFLSEQRIHPELTRLRYPVTYVDRIRSETRTSCLAVALFERGLDFSRIFGIKTLLEVDVMVEHRRRNHRILQCGRCMAFGYA